MSIIEAAMMHIATKESLDERRACLTWQTLLTEWLSHDLPYRSTRTRRRPEHPSQQSIKSDDPSSSLSLTLRILWKPPLCSVPALYLFDALNVGLRGSRRPAYADPPCQLPPTLPHTITVRIIWAKESGFDRDMAKDLEILNIKTFLSRTFIHTKFSSIWEYR